MTATPSPRTAVIVLNWNGEADSLSCIDALNRQTAGHQIIAVDNGSKDNFVSKVQEIYPDVIVIQNRRNLGFAGGVNTGIRYVMENGFQYVALINNDARPEMDWLEKLILKMDEDERIGIVTGKLLQNNGLIDSTGECYTTWGLAYPRGRNEPDNQQYDKQAEVFGATGGASLYRLKMFEHIGLFDEDFFAYYEDVDLSFRARLAGWKIFYAPQAIAHHKVGASSSKRRSFTTYMAIKNTPWLFWKNVPWSLVPKIWPRFFIAHAAIVLSALIRLKLLAVLKGLVVSFVLFPKKLFQRSKIQSSRIISDQELLSMLVNDLPPNASRLRKLFGKTN